MCTARYPVLAYKYSCIQATQKPVSFPFMGVTALMAGISHSSIYQLLRYHLHLKAFISDRQWCAYGWRSFHIVSEARPDYVQLLLGLSP